MMSLLLLLALQGLPAAPEGVQVRQVAALGNTEANSQPIRVQVHPKTGRFHVVYLNGDAWEIDGVSGAKKRYLDHETWMRKSPAKYLQALGFHIDASGRAYVVVNERHAREKPQVAHVVIYRIEDTDADGLPDKPSEWLTFQHPWGVGPFNHGACHLVTGPDGMLWLGVGSRTDHGETGKDATLDPNGETPLTACLMRLDPAQSPPKIEVVCRGLRNPFGFDWDDQGRLIASEHGPDADHPEELNWLRAGKHYGFPYLFGNLAKPMYPDAVPLPDGLVIEKPILNLGPAAKKGDGPEHTFHPHSAPCGITYYRKGTLPARYEGGFFLCRFGNYLGKEKVGFDLVHVRLQDHPEGLAAKIETVLSDLRRPIDVVQSQGKLYVLEHSSHDEQRPSRLLELSGR